ncbi:MAG: O-antigen ligase family protein [Acidimicrobiales bacterium]|nr:O-antigen ligase family protein [Acidimicrobiales bacterium]RZV48537.1 MAG: hypothetical protein EX269_01315 [Acidimicrobiales bacterium]
MTDTAAHTSDHFTIRSEDTSTVEEVTVPSPGPMAIFVVLAAVASGLVVALGFQAVKPNTPFVILGGTLLVAAILAIVGLYRYQWFLLITLAIRPALDDLVADEFGSFQPSAILGILVILVTSLHLISRRAHGRWKHGTHMSLGYIAFFVLFVPSFITSVDRGVSQAAMFGVASVMLLYIAMEQHLMDDRRFMYRMLTASLLGLIVPTITGFVQFGWTGTLDPGGSGLIRIDGSFAHPNTYATFLVFAILMMIGVAPTLDVRRRLILLSFTTFTAFLMVASFARGAWASFLLGALLMASRVNKKLVFVIGFGAVAAAAAVPGVGDRIDNLFATTGAGGGVKTDDSLGWRIGYWGRIWPFFYNNPVTGIGIDATKTQTVEGKDPHNSFLQPIIEGGVVGAIGFFGLLIIATIAALKLWRLTKGTSLDHRTKMISVASITAVFSVSAQLLTENVMLNTVVWWYINIALAWIAVVVWRPESEPAEPESIEDQLDVRQPIEELV